MKFKVPMGTFYTTGVKLLLAYIVIILLASVYESQRVIKTSKRISNNEEIVQHSKKLMTLALNSESAFRAYLLTGKKSFLETIERSQKQIHEELADLEDLADNIPPQKINNDSLSIYINNRIDFANHNIANYEANGANATMKVVETGESKLYADHIRSLVDKIQDTANGLQVQYKEANEKAFRNLQLVLLLVVAGIVLLLVGFIKKIKVEGIEKEKTAAALKQMNDELELRVKERTEELDKKEKLFRALVENNEGIISLIDEDLNVLFRSSSTSFITSMLFGKNEKIGIEEYVHPDDVASIKALVAQSVTSPGKTIPISFRVGVKGGRCLWLEGVIKNMTHDPAIGGIITNLRDVSERKESENLRKTAIERYDILAQATSDTIWDWDIVHNTMLYNDGISKMFGYTAAEVENVVDWWNEKLYPDDFKKVTEILEDVFEKGLQKFQLTYRFRCADGSYKYIFDRAYVMFDENNTPCRMIGAMQDITPQIEEEMRTSKAIITTQEQERQYIGAELHDNVNQILASSLLVLGMIRNEKMKITEAHEFIDTGKMYINNAIEELRKLSHELAPASFDNRSLKDAFMNLLMTFNLNKQFDVKLDFDDKCNTVNGEIQLNLYRIMQEQIKNIIKYSAADKIEVSLAQVNGCVNMRIFDNGKGFNVKSAKSGIGLNNIRKRAESFSGKFILNSEPGKGCEIIVTIPRGK
jgi:PAS domain S-box-containing protein